MITLEARVPVLFYDGDQLPFFGVNGYVTIAMPDNFDDNDVGTKVEEIIADRRIQSVGSVGVDEVAPRRSFNSYMEGGERYDISHQGSTIATVRLFEVVQRLEAVVAVPSDIPI